jgi:hypothetical protein
MTNLLLVQEVNQVYYLNVSIVMPAHSSGKTSGFCIITKHLPTYKFQHRDAWPKSNIPLLEHTSHSPDLAPCDSMFPK